ncbi:MAG: hypothetical protein ABIU97_10900 [Dehalococcoidia bacterium]
MHERRKEDPGAQWGVGGEPYQDWDNPEDIEDAPEGYYPPEADSREEAEDDDSYVPEPGDPDYDLSEAAGYAGYEEPARRGIMPQWVIVLFSIALIVAILIPILIRAS